MVRRFIDSWLRPRDVETLERMLAACGELGYWGVALEVRETLRREAERIAQRFGLEVFWRSTIEASSKSELYRRLSSARWSYDLISVATSDRETLMAALRDMRVDAVIVSNPNAPPLDKSIANVANNSCEIVFAHILEGGYEAFRAAIRAVKMAERKGIRLILSSGASDEYGLRSPRQIWSIPLVAEASPAYSLDAVSKYPMHILLENRERLEGRLSVDGVWRIAEGEKEVSPD